MPDQTNGLAIVDQGRGPRIFASKVLGAFSEGGGTVTFTLAVTEPRRESMDSDPTEVNAVVATLTLSGHGLNELMAAINNLATGAAALKAEKPPTGAH
jgi:hypothetical protein